MPAAPVTVQHADRLDKIVAAMPGVGSRSRARKAITTGKVDVDGSPWRDPGSTVEPGAVVSLHMNRPGTAAQRHEGVEAMARAGLTVLYQDDDVIAVDKPAGLLTDTASVEQHRHRDSVRKRLRALLRVKQQLPRVVHRIDRDTTGVVLFACNEQAEAKLRRQFRSRQPERVYRALVHGVPTWTEERWRDHTRWHKGRRILERVHAKTSGAVETLCDVRVVRTFPQAAELEIRLVTGRRNQIRLQACLRDLPLIGERLYLPPTERPTVRAPRQCLHAARLTVVHPTKSAPLTIEAPPPRDWKAVVRLLESGGR